ncbi:MAG: ABC transporter permease [Acidobacteria bacterium]|nr:ABC transporter permease [Acidobacteriota bacterium]
MKILALYLDTFRIALQSIFAHKLRAFLTLIGIIIGVASVVLVGASINGFNTYVTDILSKLLGVNHFMVARIAAVGNLSDEEWEKMDKRNKKLKWVDYEWLAENCDTCQTVGVQINNQIDIKFNGKDLLGVRISGVTANMADIEDKVFTDGRFVIPSEVEHAAMVCVIGADVKEKFFPGIDAVDKTLKIRELPLRVVGVERKRGSMFGQSFDNIVYLPLTTYGRIFGRQQSLTLHGKTLDKEDFPIAIEEARVALRNKHKLKGNEEDDFGLVNVDQLNNQVDQFTGAIAGVAVPITFISLLVGGIVVMNIMLVSVTERTFEIGLRKAVGATRNQILLQFIIESSLLSAIGGVLGLLTASGLSWVISNATPIPMTITPVYVLLSVAVSGVIGMVAGIYPAYKAAKLDPIIALTKN